MESAGITDEPATTNETPAKTRSLNVFLLKESIKDAATATKPGIQPVVIEVGEATGTLYIKQTSGAPKWLTFLRESGTAIDHLGTASASALLIIEAAGRLFAVTFGYGRSLLAPGVSEQNFGLRICLNSIDHNRIRSIDKRSFDEGAKHGREQSSRDATIGDFGLNIEQDILRAVTGSPREELNLGARISGMDSLLVTVKIAFKELPALLARLLRQYESTEYRKRFPWVDHIEEIRDPIQLALLDDRILDKLTAWNVGGANPQGLWMAVPQLLEWGNIGKLYIGSGREGDEDLHVNRLVSELRKKGEITLNRLHKTHVVAKSLDADSEVERWSAYDCLYAEDTEDGICLLSGGKWYRVERNFSKSVDDYLSRLSATTLTLPGRNPGEREDAWNARAASSDPGLVLMDKELVYLAGKVGGIEVCDVWGWQLGIFLHAKKYMGSSALSHLFAQGAVSAETFAMHQEYRTKFRERVPTDKRALCVDGRPDPSKYEVAFVLLSRSRTGINLPFFSRVTLRSAGERLNGLGYRVSLTIVPLA